MDISKKDIFSSFLSEQSDQNIFDFKIIWDLVFRRKNLIILVSILCLFYSIIRVTYLRKTRPIYSGSFQLMIKNPISATTGRSSGLSSLALNRTTATNLGGLVKYLKSPIVLKDIAKKYGLSPSALGSSVRISFSRDQFSRSDGILNVSLSYPGPNRGKRILNDLASTYLEIARLNKQEQLDEGLNLIQLATKVQNFIDSYSND